MKKENINFDELMSRQPFRVPEGYFEGFTDDFMSRLPEKCVPEAKKISLYDRVKPWLYMAAMFAGVIILFNIYSGINSTSPDLKNGAHDTRSITTISNNVAEIEDDEEFMEYIEGMYVDKYALSYIDDYMNN